MGGSNGVQATKTWVGIVSGLVLTLSIVAGMAFKAIHTVMENQRRSKENAEWRRKIQQDVNENERRLNEIYYTFTNE